MRLFADELIDICDELVCKIAAKKEKKMKKLFWLVCAGLGLLAVSDIFVVTFTARVIPGHFVIAMFVLSVSLTTGIGRLSLPGGPCFPVYVRNTAWALLVIGVVGYVGCGVVDTMQTASVALRHFLLAMALCIFASATMPSVGWAVAEIRRT